MFFGTTFSHRHLKYLNCSVPKALNKAIDLNFDYLRICSYWSDIEKVEGKYDWSELETIIKTCQKRKQKIILTLGVKAPRWPEYYFPSWLNNKKLNNIKTQEKILNFVEKTINKFQNYSCISYYQIENESLDPSGPNLLRIPLPLLKKEIALVKKLDNKEIILSLWAGLLSKRNVLNTLTKNSKIIGIDLYYRQFIFKILGKSFYIKPFDSQKKIETLLKKTNKEIWVMELQAEPWEANHQGYLSINPKSISPQKIKNFYQKASQLPVSTIFFWGFEYWFYRQKKRIMKVILKLLSN